MNIVNNANPFLFTLMGAGSLIGSGLTLIDSYGSVSKKVAQIAGTFIKIADYSSNTKHCLYAAKGIKVFTSVVDGRSGYKSVKDWVLPNVSPEIKKDQLIQDLTTQMSINKFKCSYPNLTSLLQNSTNKIVENTLNNRQANTSQLVDSLKTNFENEIKSYLHANNLIKKTAEAQIDTEAHLIAESIVEGLENKIVFKEKNYTYTTHLLAATIAITGVNLINLDGFNIINLESVANYIGSKVQVFRFLGKMSLAPIISGVASVAHVFLLIDTSRKIYKILAETKSFQLDGKPIKKELWTFTTTSLDLLNTALPLFLTLNPPVIFTLTLVAKGVGTAAFWYKPAA